MDNNNKTVPDNTNFVWMEVQVPSTVSFSVPVEEYKKYLNGEIPVDCLDHIEDEVWLNMQRIDLRYDQETFNTQITQLIEDNDIIFTDNDYNPGS
jgi:hypothetical protein